LAAVGAGADVVLGHHQHFFRGVELVDDSPVFYGLGHIAFDVVEIRQAR
jgi:poly-gamma-glutamate synthesis protein (capsule biosynthesis protein)